MGEDQKMGSNKTAITAVTGSDAHKGALQGQGAHHQGVREKLLKEDEAGSDTKSGYFQI